MKDIIILANFCSKLDGAVNGRFIYLAELLCSQGFNVELVTSDFDHDKKAPKELPTGKYQAKITYIHEPGYPNNISLKRLYSHWIWGRNVSKYLKTVEKPDCIYAAVPSLTVGLKSAMYCKKNEVIFVIDIQDIWPEAFLLIIKNKIFQRLLLPMKWYIDKAYSVANKIIAVSDTYRDRGLLVNKKDQNGLTVFLGNNADAFDEAKVMFSVEKPADEFWITYIGTLGYSYDLDCAIEGLKICNERACLNKQLKFIIIGDGPLRERFEKHAKETGIMYEFTGLLSYPQMVGLLCSCDVVINPINKGAAQSITNKVGDYALSGLPVINTQECQEYRDLIEKYCCGINCEVGNSEQVACAIEKLVNDAELRIRMGNASRKLGEDKFDRKKSYQKIVETIEYLRD